MGTNKGNCGEGFCLLRAGTLHSTRVLYLICITTLREALLYPASRAAGYLSAITKRSYGRDGMDPRTLIFPCKALCQREKRLV